MAELADWHLASARRWSRDAPIHFASFLSRYLVWNRRTFRVKRCCLETKLRGSISSRNFHRGNTSWHLQLAVVDPGHDRMSCRRHFFLPVLHLRCPLEKPRCRFWSDREITRIAKCSTPNARKLSKLGEGYRQRSSPNSTLSGPRSSLQNTRPDLPPPLS